MEESLYIIIPAYNEEANIACVIEEWYRVVEKLGAHSRLVVIDDGSKDSTYSIMKECKQDKEQLIVMTKENSGHGATLLHGYEYAMKEKADYIFQTDSDGQTVSDEFWPFWEERSEYDMIIGKRSKREDGISRKFVTFVLKYVILIRFGVYIKDANTPFRLMKREALERHFDLIPKDYFLSNVIISVLFKKKNCQVKYVPITFKPRQGGTNSINLKRITGIGKEAFSNFRDINKRM